MARDLEGFKELDRALKQLPRSTGRSAVRRVLKAALQPVLVMYDSIIPVSSGNLKSSAGISSKLASKTARSKIRRNWKNYVMMYVGAGPDPAAVQQEFGNENHDPQPSLTPAWESNKSGVLRTIKKLLWIEIEKSAKRLRKKAIKGLRR